VKVLKVLQKRVCINGVDNWKQYEGKFTDLESRVRLAQDIF